MSFPFSLVAPCSPFRVHMKNNEGKRYQAQDPGQLRGLYKLAIVFGWTAGTGDYRYSGIDRI